MNLLYVVVPSAVVLLIAYVVYGRILSRLFRLDANRPTPAHELRDDIDYQPLRPAALLPQHFSAIAAAGPIVGPILAGLMFGWLPALIWILVGGILIGGVHDFSALVASIRHKARSIAEVVRDNMTGRAYVLFLTFIWIALVYIIVAFTDVTASSFVEAASPQTGGVSGGAIASSSLLYLVLPIVMALCMRYFRMPLWLATVVFVPLVGVAIWVGQYMPLDMVNLLGDKGTAQKTWDVALLGYCLIAGVVPVWLLLQPRGHLGGFFLYAALGAGFLGLIVGGATIKYPAYTGWSYSPPPAAPQVLQEPLDAPAPNEPAAAPANPAPPLTLAPFVFIVIACGACSGFHSLIASGTTSKQLRRETDARPIGYGTMLLESMVAIVSLCCVMMFAKGSPELTGGANFVYAQGIGSFLGAMGVGKTLAISFALMAFTTFVYDTLDVCTRLGRFIIQELTGWRGTAGRWIATALTAGVPLFFLLRQPYDPKNPVWKAFWNLFGASNQLLAALTLLGVTVWLWRTYRAKWVWFVTGLPTVFMYVMSVWALLALSLPQFQREGRFIAPADPVPWVGMILIVLAGLMLIEAVRVILSLRTPPPPAGQLAPAAGG